MKIEGIMDDIDLRGDRYNVAVCLFFAPYCLLGRTSKQNIAPFSLVLSDITRNTEQLDIEPFQEALSLPRMSCCLLEPGHDIQRLCAVIRGPAGR